MPRSRAIEPGGPGGGPMTPWLLLGLFGAGYAIMLLAWVAGHIAALITGHTGRLTPLGGAFLSGLLGRHWASLWPGVPGALVGGVFAGLLILAGATATGGWLWWSGRRPQPGNPVHALASPGQVAGLLPRQVTARAQRLRPGLAERKARHIDPDATGIALGRLITRSSTTRRRRKGDNLIVRSSWEDVLLAVMAPRTGKTTSLAIPAILQAPGAVVATSNRSDVWQATSTHREALGRVWTFDPQLITFGRQRMWWDPLHRIRSVEEANRLADHFAQEVRSSGGDIFWPLAASELLSALILAAAVSGGTMADVHAWLTQPEAKAPVTALLNAGFAQSARSISSSQNGAKETRDSIYQTARIGARCLIDPQIMRWITPPSDPTIARFDPATFATTTDTIYLLSKDGAGAASPLVAGLTDQIFWYGQRQAEGCGGRLPDPMIAVLDEAANIVKIPDLPDLYSHLGSRGIIPITILQSYRQGERVWSEQGMGALWSASTVKLIGPGIDDARFADDLSRLIGEHDVTIGSRSRDGSGVTSWSSSVQERRIMQPAKVREIPAGKALLLATGHRPALIDLLPWYSGPHAAQLTQAQQAALATITQAAAAALPQWKGTS